MVVLDNNAGRLFVCRMSNLGALPGFRDAANNFIHEDWPMRPNDVLSALEAPKVLPLPRLVCKHTGFRVFGFRGWAKREFEQSGMTVIEEVWSFLLAFGGHQDG